MPEKKELKDCCRPGGERRNGVGRGFLYGIIPHSFCIAFVVFSIIGTTLATAFLKKLLLLPYFFSILIGLSFFFAMLSAVFYLRRLGLLSFEGARKKWRYLVTLFGTTTVVNLLFFFVIFPATANVGSLSRETRNSINENTVVLSVQIPCSGHAPLVSGEIRKLPGVKNVIFSSPNSFSVGYDPGLTSPGNILSIEIFRSFPAVIKEG